MLCEGEGPLIESHSVFDPRGVDAQQKSLTDPQPFIFLAAARSTSIRRLMAGG